MANDLTGQVWYIDTPMTVEDPTWKNCNIYIYALNWSNIVAAGDRLTVKDRVGRVIYDVTADAAKENVNLPHLGWVQGVVVVTLTSGNVQIMVNK